MLKFIDIPYPQSTTITINAHCAIHITASLDLHMTAPSCVRMTTVYWEQTSFNGRSFSSN